MRGTGEYAETAGFLKKWVGVHCAVLHPVCAEIVTAPLVCVLITWCRVQDLVAAINQVRFERFDRVLHQVSDSCV